ncbi:hypothetical protein FACS1894141_1940 [Spirochaetia bacterium]|nr:hypothetical protein FACS1894141_1940 [Spirochaetia bacterium]
MEQIGLHNLRYRLANDSRNDEFSMIVQCFNQMCDDLQETVEKVYMQQIKQKSAAFHALQVSVNPHFLYNTLEAIRGKLEDEGQNGSAEMIVMLARYFEYQIKGDTFVTVQEELEKLNLYAAFFSLRFEDRFDFRVDTEDTLLPYGAPKCTLQPILENYFIHGLKSGGDNTIRVNGRLEQGMIIITYRDNGRGIKAERLLELNEGMKNTIYDENSLGLINVHQRIVIAFGEGCGVTIDSLEGIGTTITVRFWARTMEELKKQEKLY